MSHPLRQITHMIYFGHTHPEFPHDESAWENLPAHLDAVASRAEFFAAKFGCGDMGRTLGRWHDFGKFSEVFQQYLKASQGDTEEGDGVAKPGRGPDHSTAGAQFAVRQARPGLGHLLAYAIAGHHAGLADGLFGQSPGIANESTLDARLKNTAIKPWETNAKATLPPEAFHAPGLDKSHGRFLADGYACAFWVRMLFSCLVDADFLATENFMNAAQSRIRKETAPPSLADLEERLTGYMAEKQADLEKSGRANSPVNRIRARVRTACMDAAGRKPGFFSLTVPTGGGKTLASLAFALKHARENGLERIVYVIPFTSIIEQNAAVFRTALGDDAVLEHHSNFDNEPGDDATQEERRSARQTKLSAENWDAPLVVTTGVQFFESLHAHKTSRCRKLHNLSKAVIILDEAQTLPVPLLQPCLRAIEQLAKNYGSTVVLCTATQPAIGKRDSFPCGLTDITEIIPTEIRLHEGLRRVTVERIRENLTDEALAERLVAESRVLCVVNTRRHARELFEKLRVVADSPDGIFHLSAQMCPAHRTAVLDEVRRRLAAAEPCRLVSSQLIEAGVDVDFPCVYRTMAGLDAIAQAAGRCNREGRLTEEPGRVFVFSSAEHKTPAGFLRETADKGLEVLALPEFADDVLAPEAVEKYFRLLYWQNYSADETKDQTNFVKLAGGAGERRQVVGGLLPRTLPATAEGFLNFSFRTLGENFRLIEETSESIIVPYGDAGAELAEKLRAAYEPAERMKLLRKLQRYAVSIPKPVFAAALADGRIQNVHDSFAMLVSTELHYSANFGVSLGQSAGSTEYLSV